MILKISLLLLVMANPDSVVYDFSRESTLAKWNIVNDVVMGGRSMSSLSVNEMGNGVFSGEVSLENNGGFASVRYSLNSKEISSFKSIAILLKGDGLRYQFRVKSKQSDSHSYAYYFKTSGDWQWIEIPMHLMYPTWRGRRLQIPNYPGQSMEEIAILIGNGKPEEFEIEIDRIILR